MNSIAITTPMIQEHAIEARVRRMLIMALLSVCVVYVYGVGASVLDVVVRKDAIKSMAAIESTIAQLEREQAELSGNITMASANSYGLVRVSDKKFTQRTNPYAYIGTNR